MNRTGTLVLSLCLASAFLLSSRSLQGADVIVRFAPSDPEVGPFPSDSLTIADPAQKTGLRINLPMPDCNTQAAACAEIGALNQMDGFNPQPRLRVRFSGAVDPGTLREGLKFVWLETLTDEEWAVQTPGHVTPVNQVIYDPATDTAYAKPDEFLSQHRRYAVIVTDAARDLSGNPVLADPAFSACLGQSEHYCGAVTRAVQTASPAVAPQRIVAASVFTTMSATAWLEKARAQIQTSPLNLQPVGSKSVFPIGEIASITLRRQVHSSPAGFEDFTVPFPGTILQGVSRVAFGTFHSPSFLDERQTIPSVPTGAEIALPAGANQISFHVFLPETAMPAGGYPVVIFGHGLNDSRFGGPTLVAGTLARSGFATVAINAVGHGSGPESTLLIQDRMGNTAEIPAGGRSLDLNNDGTIESDEGCVLVGVAGLRDCLRQTSLDIMQLVRAIRAGAHVDNDGVIDLNGGKIYYAGQSLGAIYGTVLNAVEPDIRAAALNVGGGTIVEIVRWGPSFRSNIATYLAGRAPDLVKAGADFSDNYVLRYRPVKVNDVPGAVEVQNILENLEWLQAPGDPVSYAPHLKTATLPGVPIKPVLWQAAYGDRTVPNPTNTELIRAANMRESTRLYRHDLARAVSPQVADNPHAFLVDITTPAGIAVAIAAQSQITGFLASDGATIPDPNVILRPFFGHDLFELPAFLPEDLNF